MSPRHAEGRVALRPSRSTANYSRAKSVPTSTGRTQCPPAGHYDDDVAFCVSGLTPLERRTYLVGKKRLPDVPWEVVKFTPDQQEIERDMTQQWGDGPINEAWLVDPDTDPVPEYGIGYTIEQGPTTFRSTSCEVTEALRVTAYTLDDYRAAIRRRKSSNARDLLALVLAGMDANAARAARFLGCSRRTIYNLKARGMDILERLERLDGMDAKLDLLITLNGGDIAAQAEAILENADETVLEEAA